MDIFRCVIVDDEEMAIKILQTHLKQVPNYRVEAVYTNAVEAFLALESMEIDVLFLDIQMPQMTGLSMLKMLKQPPLTVLTTAHREYALEGYELEVVDYLLKPIGIKRFLQCISRLNDLLRLRHISNTQESKDNTVPQPLNTPAPTSEENIKEDQIYIRSDRAFHKILLNTIIRVEAIKNHIRIYCTDQNYITLMPLSTFEEQLPVENFLRIHRSHIINLSHVEKFDNASVTLAGKSISIGRSYKSSVKPILEERLGLK